MARIADEIVPRGWEFDDEYSADDFITWLYPPSGVRLDDESLEPVTRIWVAEPTVVHVILVGSGEGEALRGCTVEELFERLDAIERHRASDPRPDWG